MAGYIGSQTPVVSNGSQRKYTFTATAAQTVFTGMDIPNPQQIQVFQNGVRLVITTDYTVSSGTTVTLVNAASAGDSLVVILFADYQLLDTDSLALTGDFTVDTNTLYVDSTNNRVGVGTVSPLTEIGFPIGNDIKISQAAGTDHLAGNAGSIGLTITDGGGHSGVFVNNSHDGTYSDQFITFKTAEGGVSTATERMRIDSSGFVGIGTSSPDEKLHVQSSGDTKLEVETTGTTALSGHSGLYLNTGNGSYLIQNLTTSDNTHGVFRIVDITNAAERLRIDSLGRLYSAQTYTNTSGGSANVGIGASGEFYRSTSSRRYKNTINDATHGLAELLTLRPVTYKGNSDGDTIFGGLVAEEVHEAGLTEFVQYDEDGLPDALSYSNMVALCIKAIQEQQAKIEALEARVTALEGS